MRDPSLTQIVALVAFAGACLGLAIGHLPVGWLALSLLPPP